MQNKLIKVFALTASIASFSPAFAAAYEGSTPSEVWSVIKNSPYAELPNNKVSFLNFFSRGSNIFKSAMRTIASEEDLLPPFKKLVHANGVCLKGTWNITEDNPFGGYFKAGSQAVIIVRASVALSDTTVGHYRGFGFAGKLFPTTDFFTTSKYKTANFFTIDDLTGTLAKHYTDGELTNEPAISARLSQLGLGPVASAAAAAFTAADLNPGIRQLYKISEFGEADPSSVRTPYWMKISASPDTPKIDEADFRNELLTQVMSFGTVKFDIAVSEKHGFSSKKEWQKIGTIVLDEAVTSEGCDMSLHFSHPKFRWDLNY